MAMKFSRSWIFWNIKKIKNEGRTTYNFLENALFDILILSPWKLFNAVRAKQTSLKFSTSGTDFFGKK